MPSRMSCSLTTSDLRARPHPFDDHVEHERATPDDVDPARVHHRERGPLGAGHREQPRGDRVHVRPAAGATGGWRRVVRRQAEVDRGDRRHRPGDPDEGPGHPSGTVCCRKVDSAVDVRAGGRDLRRRSAGRCAGVARSGARSRCRPTPTRQRALPRARTPSSRRRCRRRGTAPVCRPSSSRVAPSKDSWASSSPVTTSGSTPIRSRTPFDEVGAVLRVAGGRRRDEAHPLGAEPGDPCGVDRRTQRRSARGPPEPAGRSGRRPARAGRPPSAGRGRPGCRQRRRRRRRAAGSSSSRSRSPRRGS